MKTESVEATLLIKRGNAAISINTEVEFGGKNYIDIRYMYADKTSELKPTQKGVMLTPCEFKKLYEYMVLLHKDDGHKKRLLKLRKKEKSNLTEEKS